MSFEVLRKPNLSLKECLDLFESDPFTLETFLKSREECFTLLLKSVNGNYSGIISVLRANLADFFRQAFTIFNDEQFEREIFLFSSKFLFKIVVDLIGLIKNSDWDRQELTKMWHLTILAGESLKPFLFDFSLFLNEVFIQKIFEIIKISLNERLCLVEPVKESLNVDVIDIHLKYDLNTTIALNAVIESINQVRLCPHNAILNDLLVQEIKNNTVLPDNIKNWAVKNI